MLSRSEVLHRQAKLAKNVMNGPLLCLLTGWSKTHGVAIFSYVQWIDAALTKRTQLKNQAWVFVLTGLLIFGVFFLFDSALIGGMLLAGCIAFGMSWAFASHSHVSNPMFEEWHRQWDQCFQMIVWLEQKLDISILDIGGEAIAYDALSEMIKSLKDIPLEYQAVIKASIEQMDHPDPSGGFIIEYADAFG